MVGAYGFKAYDIPTNDMLAFMRKHFRDEQPQSIRYYHVMLHAKERVVTAIWKFLIMLMQE